MKRIIAIAHNTFKETVRDRILYGLLIFALLLLPGSRLVIPLSIGQEVKIMKDFGFAAISLFGLMIAVVVGTSLVHKELDKRTIYVLVAKPVRRWELLIGKYLGLMATLLLAFVVMALVMAATVVTLGGRVDRLLWLTLLGLYLQLMAVTAVAIFFSTLASPALSAVFTICLFIVGTAADQLRLFAERMPGDLVKAMVKAASYMVPNLHLCNFRTEAVYGLPVEGQRILLMLLYIFLYTLLILLLSSVILEKKDLK